MTNKLTLCKLTEPNLGYSKDATLIYINYERSKNLVIGIIADETDSEFGKIVSNMGADVKVIEEIALSEKQLNRAEKFFGILVSSKNINKKDINFNDIKEIVL